MVNGILGFLLPNFTLKVETNIRSVCIKFRISVKRQYAQKVNTNLDAWFKPDFNHSV